VEHRIDSGWLRPAPASATIAAQVASFPFAVKLQLEWASGSPIAARTSGSSGPHVVLLLAARLPPDAPYWVGRGEAARLREQLEAAGFRLELRTGGLALLADGDTVNTIREEPARLALVGPLAFALGRLAHLLRAEAPAPLNQPSSSPSGGAAGVTPRLANRNG